MRYDDYSNKTKFKYNLGKCAPFLVLFLFIGFFGWFIKSNMDEMKKRNACTTINSMFNKTSVRFDRATEECIGYIRGDLHSFELRDNDTVDIKRKVVKVNYDYGQ